MAQADLVEDQKPLSAPYTAFASVKTALSQFKEHGAPSRVDRTVLPTFSGAVGGQVVTALRFLKLIDNGNNSRPELDQLVAAVGADEWPKALREVLGEAYTALLQMNFETASPSQFTEAFRREYPATEDVSRKQMTFFLNAAREAEIKISPYILRNKKPRTNGVKRRARSNEPPTAAPSSAVWMKATTRAASAGRKGGGLGAGGPDFHVQPTQKPSAMLLEHFAPNEMDERTQEAIWTLIKFFKGKEL